MLLMSQDSSSELLNSFELLVSWQQETTAVSCLFSVPALNLYQLQSPSALGFHQAVLTEQCLGQLHRQTCYHGHRVRVLKLTLQWKGILKTLNWSPNLPLNFSTGLVPDDLWHLRKKIIDTTNWRDKKLRIPGHSKQTLGNSDPICFTD